jgi:uncharacterized membrane protein
MFFASYLGLVALIVGRSAEQLRERAAVEDEGIFAVVMIVVTAVSFCFGSIFVILHQSHGAITVPLVLALAAAFLGWLTLHVVAAFHYAHLFYGTHYGAELGTGHPPLLFPGSADPTPWDFLYYAFVVGMTAQVSDVQVVGATMRRATLGHGVVSFFFNTVLIAMAVNAVVTLAT